MGDPFGVEDPPTRGNPNWRYQCENCSAFVSDAAGKRQMAGHSWMHGDDYGPTCEPGKGCNRAARTLRAEDRDA